MAVDRTGDTLSETPSINIVLLLVCGQQPRTITSLNSGRQMFNGPAQSGAYLLPFYWVATLSNALY